MIAILANRKEGSGKDAAVYGIFQRPVEADVAAMHPVDLKKGVSAAPEPVIRSVSKSLTDFPKKGIDIWVDEYSKTS